MAKSRQLTELRARWVFPGDGPPLADGAVGIDGSRIVAVGPYVGGNGSEAAEVVDLGNAAILPGLVNAHTHLEFSDLTEPLGAPGLPFADWIRSVVAYRGDAERHAAIRRGLDECLRSGTVVIGEIASGQWLPGIEPSAAVSGPPTVSLWPPQVTVFHELLGLAGKRAEIARDAADQFLDNPPVGVRVGLSPHASYSVRLELLTAAVGLSRARRLPLAMHLAESPDEMRLLQRGDGPLRELFIELDVWDPSAIPSGARTLDYLRLLADAERALVIHGTLLDDDEISFLAARAERMSVVYCPRTHARFGFAPYPLEKLLTAGVTVALGTDSRASNPDLSLLDELRFVAARDTIDPQRLLRMATLDGAKALGLADQLGGLAPGRAADLTIVGLPPSDGDPYEHLFDPRSTVLGVIRGGQYSPV